MTGKLIKSPSGGPLDEGRLEPVVESEARPPAADLLRARADITHNTRLRTIFMGAKEAQRPPEEVADVVGSALAAIWGEDMATEAYNAALYLADEHAQLEPGVTLVSSETGKVLVVLRPEDLVKLSPVPREGSGTLAQPLTRIRPDIEAFVTSWQFNFKREQEIADELALRGHQTTALREDGDPRLQIVTKAGRRELAKRYAGHTPKELLGRVGSSAWAFLNHLDIVDLGLDEKAPEGSVLAEAVSCVDTGIEDLQSRNLRFDVPNAMRTSLSNGWVREIAVTMANAAKQRYSGMQTVQAENLTKELFGSLASVWVVPPELVRKVYNLKPEATLLIVPDAPLIGLERAKVGRLYLPDTFGVENTEVFDKWSVVSHLQYALQIDWQFIRYIPVTGIEHQAVLV